MCLSDLKSSTFLEYKPQQYMQLLSCLLSVLVIIHIYTCHSRSYLRMCLFTAFLNRVNKFMISFQSDMTDLTDLQSGMISCHIYCKEYVGSF